MTKIRPSLLVVAVSPLLLSGCCLFAPSPKPQQPASWQMEEFVIGNWGFPSDETQLRQFVADGFNTVIAVPDQLPQAQRHGLKAILAADPDAAKQYINDPMIWGYFVLDEPARKKIPYADVAAKVAPFHQLDPARPAYVNLNELDDPAAFIRAVHPRVLSYDYYQWWAGREPFYPLLEKYRTAALDAGIPLIVWAEASAVPNGPRPADNLAKIRLSVYSALAYGAKGVMWWGWRPDNRDVAAVNAELNRLGPELMKLRSVAVYHTAPNTKLPADSWINSVAMPEAVVGTFKDAQSVDYAFIAATNQERAASSIHLYDMDEDRDLGPFVFISIPEHRTLERFDAERGTWSELKMPTQGLIASKLMEQDTPTQVFLTGLGNGGILIRSKPAK